MSFEKVYDYIKEKIVNENFECNMLLFALWILATFGSSFVFTVITSSFSLIAYSSFGIIWALVVIAMSLSIKKGI